MRPKGGCDVRYASTIRYMIRQGMTRAKAVAYVRSAFALSDKHVEQIERELDQ